MAPVFEVLRQQKSVWPATVLRGVCMFIVISAPIPAASNHPILWLFWASVIGWAGVFAALTTAVNAPALTPVHRAIIALGMTFVLYAAWQAIAGFFGFSFFASATPGASLLGAIRTASLLLFFILCSTAFQTQNHIRQGLAVLLFAIVGQAIWALIALRLLGDITLLGEKNSYVGVATGTFVNRNSLATFLGMGLVLTLACILGQPRRSPVLPLPLLWLCAAFILLALVSTQSRMGLAATAVGCAVVLHRRALNRAKVLTVLLLILPAATALVFFSPVSARFADVGSSFQTRWTLYRQVADMISARPWAGHGLDSFSLAFQAYHRPPLTAEFVWDKAHSMYLQLWAESGIIVGTVPMLLAVIAVAGLLAKGNRHPAVCAAIGACVVASVHSLVDFSLEIPANYFVLTMLIALGLQTRVPGARGKS